MRDLFHRHHHLTILCNFGASHCSAPWQTALAFPLHKCEPNDPLHHIDGPLHSTVEDFPQSTKKQFTSFLYCAGAGCRTGTGIREDSKWTETPEDLCVEFRQMAPLISPTDLPRNWAEGFDYGQAIPISFHNLLICGRQSSHLTKRCSGPATHGSSFPSAITILGMSWTLPTSQHCVGYSDTVLIQQHHMRAPIVTVACKGRGTRDGEKGRAAKRLLF